MWLLMSVLLLSIMLSRFIHVVNESVLYSFFMAELYPIVWIYHILASLVAQMVKTLQCRETRI